MLKKEMGVSTRSFYINVLIGTAVAVGVILLTMLISSAIMVLLDINIMYASPISSVCAAIGTFCGAYFSARKNKSKGIVNGLMVAAIIYILVGIVALFLDDNFTVMSLIHLAVIVLSGCIGGIMGVNKQEKRKII